MPDIELITTTDGSHSLRNIRLDETYHSVHGAIRESEHVFIKNGLHFFAHRGSSKEIRILEIGFGTGLNALLALRYAGNSPDRIHYTTLEAYPLENSILTQLNYPTVLNTPAAPVQFQQIHSADWEHEVIIEAQFTLLKKMIKVEEWNPGLARFDVVFFDAFAPSKQPAIWELPILKKVAECMSEGAVLVTYCAKGQLKRDLKSLGLEVETLEGPPGKKEMVRAKKS